MGHRFGSFHQIFHEKGDKEKGNKVDEFASLFQSFFESLYRIIILNSEFPCNVSGKLFATTINLLSIVAL